MSSLRAYQGRMGRGGGGGGSGCNQGMPTVNGTAWDTGQPNGVSQFGRRISTASVLSKYNVYFHGGSMDLYPVGGGNPIHGSSCSGGRGFGFGIIPDLAAGYAGGFVDQDASGTGLCGANFRRNKCKVSYNGKSSNYLAIPDTGTNQMGQGFMMEESARAIGINTRSLRSQPVQTEQSIHSYSGPVRVSYTFDPNPSPVTVSMGVVSWNAHGDKFDVVPMRFMLQRVNIFLTKNYTVWESTGSGGATTYDCSSNQVSKGDIHNLLPKSKFAYAYHY